MKMAEDSIMEMITISNTEPYCRGCLAETGKLHDMVERGILEDFYKFTDIKDHSQDIISIYLCDACLIRLEDCQSFRNMCQGTYGIKRKEIMKLKAATNAELHSAEDVEKTQKSENKVSCLLHDKKLVIMITAPVMEAKIELPCPYRCNETFLKKPDLLNHLMRKHDASSDFQIDLQYFCPVTDCAYHAYGGCKRFSGRKFLNQHLNKVHSGQPRSCENCQLNFPNGTAYAKHLDTCNFKYECNVCRKVFKTNDRLIVHLMRRHPLLHQQYKMERKSKRQETKRIRETHSDFVYDSPKRTSATQTLTSPSIKNDVALPSWLEEPRKDEISTQTAFELLKTQSDEDSMCFQEAVSLTDIQTQTFPLEFGLTTSNKETITSETQSPDISIKETQTCCCLYESPKFSARLFDSVSSSPVLNLTSTETQTGVSPYFDPLLGFTSAETQTSFEELLDQETL